MKRTLWKKIFPKRLLRHSWTDLWLISSLKSDGSFIFISFKARHQQLLNIRNWRRDLNSRDKSTVMAIQIKEDSVVTVED